MNKFLFLLVVTFGGLVGSLVSGPFIPLVIYYFYAILRPQFLWQFQLSSFPEMNWSLYIGMIAILTYLPWLFGIIGSGRESERYTHPKFTWSHRLMIGFGIWNTLSYLFANNMDRAYPVYEEFLKIFFIYLLATQVVRSFRQVKILYLMITLSIGYIAIDVVHMYVTTGYLLLYKRGYAGLDNNGAALVLAMGIPMCYFAWEFTKGWYRWGFLLVIPFIAEAVMSSYSRGAMLSSIVGGLCYILFSRKKKFLIFCMVCATLAVPVVAGNEIKERFFSAQQASTDESAQSRLTSWWVAVQIANDYPVFGAGIRNSNLLTLQYGADMEGRTIHNIYLQIAADAGWPGMFWYIALATMSMLAIWRVRWRLRAFRDENSDLIVGMTGGIFCSLITFFFGAIFLSLETVELPYILMLMGGQMWAILNAQISQPKGMAMSGLAMQARMQRNARFAQQQNQPTPPVRPVPPPPPQRQRTIPTPSGSTGFPKRRQGVPTLPDIPPPGPKGTDEL
jgi:probable O-glycosylation ligase (exosortase A-associated)